MKPIAADKWKHFLTGIVMGIMLQAAGLYFLPDSRWTWLLVLLLVVAISYGFELFSRISGKGHHDVMDAVASTAGGILGMILLTLYRIS